jgi:asparagine synthase (glutamine-hydrolysing)
VLVRDGVAIGHRRLAIIDRETGGQPMTDDSGRVWITHNGEIYNYQALRAELAASGHRFRTRSDTEVILHAYRAWGTDCVSRFRGMFAFAILDPDARRLVLARDHFGIKPLYYRVGDGYFAFASELAALRVIDDAPPRGSLVALEHYLRFHYIPAPDTIFQGVFKLPPATILTLDLAGGARSLHRYWDLTFPTSPRSSGVDAAPRADMSIHESVAAHLVADVPFGILLSGGIDSTTITSHVARLTDEPVRAFAIGFDEADWSELRWAETAARRCGVELASEIVDESIVDRFPTLLRHYGEPFGDNSALATFAVARLARQSVPMVLSGDGGDEAFGGYDKYVHWVRGAALVPSLRHDRLRAVMSRYRRRLRHGGGNVGGWEFLLAQSSRRRRRSLWRDSYRDLIDVGCTAVDEAEARAEAWDVLSYAQYLDYHSYLVSLLTKVDTAAMFHGVEVRTPFVDRELLAVASALPLNQRLELNGRGAITKPILKNLLSDAFGEAFVHRPKAGFVIPLERWLQPGRRTRAEVESRVCGADAPLAAFFRPDAVQAELRLFDAGRGSSSRLWALFALSLWLDDNSEIRFA